MKKYLIKSQEIKNLASSGYSARGIGRELNIPKTSVIRLVKFLNIKEITDKNGRAIQHEKRFKDGRSIFKKFKKSFCEECGSTKNLEAHHIKPAKYKNNKTIVSGDHSEENIMTLCNSCHQKKHYRELGRVPANSSGKTFYKKDVL